MARKYQIIMAREDAEIVGRAGGGTLPLDPVGAGSLVKLPYTFRTKKAAESTLASALAIVAYDEGKRGAPLKAGRGVAKVIRVDNGK